MRKERVSYTVDHRESSKAEKGGMGQGKARQTERSQGKARQGKEGKDDAREAGHTMCLQCLGDPLGFAGSEAGLC